MKLLVFALAFLLMPLPSYAVVLINCDANPHAVLVLSEGDEDHIKLDRFEQFADYSPVLSFQVEGIGPIMLARPEDKYCITDKGRLSITQCCKPKMKQNVRNGILVR